MPDLKGAVNPLPPFGRHQRSHFIFGRYQAPSNSMAQEFMSRSHRISPVAPSINAAAVKPTSILAKLMGFIVASSPGSIPGGVPALPFSFFLLLEGLPSGTSSRALSPSAPVEHAFSREAESWSHGLPWDPWRLPIPRATTVFVSKPLKSIFAASRGTFAAACTILNHHLDYTFINHIDTSYI